MITLLKSYVANPVDNNTIKSRAIMLLVGLSTDEKPLIEFKDVEIENGSSFIQIDTSKIYKYDEENNEWIQQVTEDDGGSTIIIDSALSVTSENPVQNKVITRQIQSSNGTLGSLNAKFLQLTKGSATTSSKGLMSAEDKQHLDAVYEDYSSALVAMGVNNS